MARLPSLAGVLLLMVLAVAPALAREPTQKTPAVQPPAPQPGLTTGTTHRPAAATEPQWPKLLPSGAPHQSTAAGWSFAEIEVARARCNAILARVKAVVVPVEPIRDGAECGAPAPVELISVGSDPQITFSPPAVVTCDMVETLANWMAGDVQPAARKMLGSAIVRVEVMSSYSCRNAYGRRSSRLSEHGRANALDIKSFMTERAASVDLLADWGMTGRDIRAKVAAAEAAKRQAEAQSAQKRAADNAAAQKRGPAGDAATAQTPAQTPAQATAPQAPSLKAAIADTLTAIQPPAGVPLLAPPSGTPRTFGLREPSRLGGPKRSAGQAAATGPIEIPLTDPKSAKQRFLRHVHTTGCRTFGTILGPESNEAHRNHFHIDLAPRATGNYCE